MNDALNPYGNMICFLAAGVFPGLGDTPIIFPSPELSLLGSPRAPSLTSCHQDMSHLSTHPSLRRVQP